LTLLVWLSACQGPPTVTVPRVVYAEVFPFDDGELVEVTPGGVMVGGRPVAGDALVHAVQQAAMGAVLVAASPDVPWAQVDPVLRAAAAVVPEAAFVVAGSVSRAPVREGLMGGAVALTSEVPVFREAPTAPTRTGRGVRLMGALAEVGGGDVRVGGARPVGQVLGTLDALNTAGIGTWWVALDALAPLDTASSPDPGPSGQVMVRKGDVVQVVRVALGASVHGHARPTPTPAAVTVEEAPPGLREVTGGRSRRALERVVGPSQPDLSRCLTPGAVRGRIRADVGAGGNVVGTAALVEGVTGSARALCEGCLGAVANRWVFAPSSEVSSFAVQVTPTGHEPGG